MILRTVRALCAVPFAVSLVVALPEKEAVPEAAPKTYAILLNGGGSMAKNYLSHFHHLQDMAAALQARGIPPDRIVIFSADGEDPGRDLLGRGVQPELAWLLEGTPAGRSFYAPEMMNSTWEGMTLRPARMRELRSWFSKLGRTLKTGDTLLIFVTDHGSKNIDDPDNGFISLWNETLSVLEYRALLGYLKPGVRVVNMMSQCYSGAFAVAMSPLSSPIPTGDICGFYSTTADREAYGCYPEGRDRDRIGYAFRAIDAMAKHESLDNVQGAVVITDTTPDVPMRSSDLFLDHVLRDEAAARGQKVEALVDQELVQAWKDRGRWEREIRTLDRLGEVYGMFSPRSLGELSAKIESLEGLSKELDTYENRWDLVLDDLRADNYGQFIAANAAWKERLEERNLQTLDPGSKRELLGELLPVLQDFTVGREDVWKRINDLRQTDEDAKSARYRTDVRLAALLRMRMILMRVAGTQFLDDMAEGASTGADPGAGVPPAGSGAKRLAPGPSAADHAIAQKIGAPAPARRARAACQACDEVPTFRLVPGEPNAPAVPDSPDSHHSKAAPAKDAEASAKEAEPPALASASKEELLRALHALQACEGTVLGKTAADGDESPPWQERVEPLAPFEEDLKAVKHALPSWLGIRFQPVTDAQQKAQGLTRGTVMVEQIYPDGPAAKAGLQRGDFILGPPKNHFTEPTQLREWTMTSPRNEPVTLDVMHGDDTRKVHLTLDPYPTKVPDLPPPLKAGDSALKLPSLKLVPRPAGATAGQEQTAAVKLPAGALSADGLPAGRYMLFFWATWCVPCKVSVPELMAWSRSSGVPVLAVSDEDEPTLTKFLTGWTRPFPQLVASDELRDLHVGYGVSGTPTFVLVDASGKIEWRQTGYPPATGLDIPNWTWKDRP